MDLSLSLPTYAYSLDYVIALLLIYTLWIWACNQSIFAQPWFVELFWSQKANLSFLTLHSRWLFHVDFTVLLGNKNSRGETN